MFCYSEVKQTKSRTWNVGFLTS